MKPAITILALLITALVMRAATKPPASPSAAGQAITPRVGTDAPAAPAVTEVADTADEQEAVSTPAVSYTDGPTPLTVEEFADLQKWLRDGKPLQEWVDAHPDPALKQSPTLAEQMLATSGTMVYVFTADWCGPCIAAKPTIDRIERSGVRVLRLDYDADYVQAVKQQYRVDGVPTFIVLTDGKETFRTHDVRTLESHLRPRSAAPVPMSQFQQCGPNGCGPAMQPQTYRPQRRALLPWRRR